MSTVSEFTYLTADGNGNPNPVALKPPSSQSWLQARITNLTPYPLTLSGCGGIDPQFNSWVLPPGIRDQYSYGSGASSTIGGIFEDNGANFATYYNVVVEWGSEPDTFGDNTNPVLVNPNLGINIAPIVVNPTPSPNPATGQVVVGFHVLKEIAPARPQRSCCTIKADIANTDYVSVGFNYNGNLDKTNGYKLWPGEFICISNPLEIYGITSVADCTVSFEDE